MAKINAVFVATLYMTFHVDVKSFDLFAFAVLCFYDNLLTRRLQVHINDPRSIAEVEHFVLVVHYVID